MREGLQIEWEKNCTHMYNHIFVYMCIYKLDCIYQFKFEWQKENIHLQISLINCWQ